MKLLSREVFVEQGGGPRGLMPGSAVYFSPTQNHLLFRYAWESDSDAYDDWTEMLSLDNGRTWSEPQVRLSSTPVEGGHQVYSENATFLDPHTGAIWLFVDRCFRPEGREMHLVRWEVEFARYDPRTGEYRRTQRSDFGLPGGLMISFCVPLLTSTGRLLIPAQTAAYDEQGNPLWHPNCWDKSYAALVIIGERRSDGWDWRLSDLVHLPLEVSSRGLCEPAVAELRDGRLVMICRGDNTAFRERPGFKWVAYSQDGGDTWSAPTPLRFDDHTLLESGGNGSALFRSDLNGRLYWIGNPCLSAERAHGNWPRSPLAIFEVQEEPFALKRHSMLIIDQRRPEDHPGVQLSNFRFYQDRETGDVVLFMSRLGERSEDWRLADLYRYRIRLD